MGYHRTQSLICPFRKAINKCVIDTLFPAIQIQPLCGRNTLKDVSTDFVRCIIAQYSPTMAVFLVHKDNTIYVKGGYLDFSHLTELENIYITEI